LLEDVQPDVIHLQNIHGHITPSILYEFESRGLPVFWTLHDYKLICPNTVLLSGDRICEACKGGRFHQCTMRKCKKDSFSASLVATAEAMVHRSQKIADKVSRFVSPSRFLLQKFREFGWVEDRLVHVRNFLPSGALDGYRYNDTGYGVYLGRLEPPKGVASFLKASSLVKGLKIKIVGEGNQRSELEQMATTLGLADVEFSGYLAGEELKEMLQNCSFVVVPSEWYENCPYSVMEAMAAGKPVVASAIGGLPELIEDGVTGFLFEMGNHVALAERMRTLAKGSVLRREMGARAYEKARAEFAPDRHYRALMDVYCSRV
jgi:glycosyltransferase involved in cell wall biosynthesis